MKYFAYCRKSSEAEERQALSLQSQAAELQRAFGNDPDIQIVDVIFESMSAKAPGRPLFNQMLERIRLGEADGILAWHPDRLARNSVDGGLVIYLLDQSVLKNLRFASFSFENSSQGKFMLQIMFGYSKYYVDNLSENVRRGNRARAASGWRPVRVPVGYRNCPEKHTIEIDPQTFPLIQRLFRTALEGTRSVSELWRLATYEWGLRLPKQGRVGGGPWTISALYRALRNEFYCGYFQYGGVRQQGKHQPAITPTEFAQVQSSLRRRNTRPRRPSRYSFTYTGLIRCASCGLSITAEHKRNRQGHRYIYYHCSRRNVGPRCREPSVQAHKIDEQIVRFLESLRIDELIDRQLRLAACEIQPANEDSELARAGIDRAIADLKRQETTVLDLRIRSLISDEEFSLRRAHIQQERDALTEARERLDKDMDWFEPFEDSLMFSNMATKWYRDGTDDIRRLIIQTAGSNLRLGSQEVKIDAVFPFSSIRNISTVLHERAYVDDVRTRVMMGDAELLKCVENIRTIRRLVNEKNQWNDAA